MDRNSFAALIASRLSGAEEGASATFKTYSSLDQIGFFVVDDLLPEDVASCIAAAFPAKEAMIAKNSMRERKSIMATMSECDPLVGDVVYAFQEPEVVQAVASITGIRGLEADPLLYAGGISAMGEGDFLNPHLDNSHDRDRKRWRVLNLLYYVTPDWPYDCGGNLELWHHGVGAEVTEIHSRFNRLIVMATHGASWHSVNPVKFNGVRKCVSNYYFAQEPLRRTDRPHVTSFRGRPDHTGIDIALMIDGAARNMIRKVKPGGIAKVTHVNESPS